MPTDTISFHEGAMRSRIAEAYIEACKAEARLQSPLTMEEEADRLLAEDELLFADHDRLREGGLFAADRVECDSRRVDLREPSDEGSALIPCEEDDESSDAVRLVF